MVDDTNSDLKDKRHDIKSKELKGKQMRQQIKNQKIEEEKIRQEIKVQKVKNRKEEVRSQKNDEKEDSKKTHTGRNIGLVVLGIIIIAAIIFYELYLSGGIVSFVLGGENGAPITTLLTHKIASSKQITVSYTGSITSNVTVHGSDPLITMPFSIEYLKFYNDTRAEISIKGNQSAGIDSLDAIGVSTNNGNATYACQNVNEEGFKCIQLPNGNLGEVEEGVLSFFNITSVSGIYVSSALPSFYDGKACWLIKGQGTVSGDGILVNDNNASLSFTGCMLPNNYLPITLNATITPHTGNPVYLQLQNLNVTPAASQLQVDTLPANITNP